MATTPRLPTELKTLRGAPRMDPSGDEALARLVAKANESAFAALYARHHQALYRYCRSILRNESDAQDALQSTWTRALVALRRGQRDAPVRPWLYRIAHNESVSLLRRRPLRAVPTRAEPGSDLDASAEERVIERERFTLLIEDLQALHPRQRGALVMRELSGLSHEEIAAALQTSVSAAKQLVYEARRELAEFAEGRATSCEEVCRRISDGDRRVLRGHRLRAHLRHCPGCARFASTIQDRTAALHQLVPWLPAVAGTAVLEGALRGGTATGTGAAVATAGGSGAVTATGATAAAGAPVAVVTKAIAIPVVGKSLLAAAALSVGTVSVAAVSRSPQPTPRPAAVHAAAPQASAPAPASPRAARHRAQRAVPAVSARPQAAPSPRHAVRRRPSAGGPWPTVPRDANAKTTTRTGRPPGPARQAPAPGPVRKASAAPPPGQARATHAGPPPGHATATHSGSPLGQAKETPPPDQAKKTPQPGSRPTPAATSSAPGYSVTGPASSP